MDASVTETFQRDGIQLDTEHGELTIDLNQPRLVKVRGINTLTGKIKDYILKVGPTSLVLF
jgi:hypothetical protein